MKALGENPALAERVERLQSISAVGQILALTWALEIGEVGRFRSIKRAASYCGLTSAERNSAGKQEHGPISKQRNKHLQTVLIEADKLAPRWNEQLAALHAQELGRGNRNRATLEVARRLVAYLMGWTQHSCHEVQSKRVNPLLPPCFQSPGERSYPGETPHRG